MLGCFLCVLKQRVSIVSLVIFSTMLFLAGCLTIYVSIRLFMGAKVFGGDREQKEEENDGQSAGYSDELGLFAGSLLHWITLLAGVLSLTVAMLGACTAKAKDRCAVICFSSLTSALLLTFTILAAAMMGLHLQNQEFVDSYCQKDHKKDSSALTAIEKAVFQISKE